VDVGLEVEGQMAKTFYEWLTAEDHDDQNIKDIAKIAKENKLNWISVNSISSGIQAVNKLEGIDDAEKNRVIIKLSAAFESYDSNKNDVNVTSDQKEVVDPRQLNWLQRQFEYILNNPKVILSIVSFFIVIGIVYFIASNVTPTTLSDISSARGFIAFIFAVGTVGIGFMMVYIALTDDKTEFKDKFDLGKQIFTALLGVFATIVGFYFGSMDQTSNQDAGQRQPAAAQRAPGEPAGEGQAPQAAPGQPGPGGQ
jgi:hypothetical protein